jgi:hypothetical protein
MKERPEGVICGRIKINRAKLYTPSPHQLPQIWRYKGQNPELIIKYNSPKKEFEFMNNKEIGLSITGNWELEERKESKVKPELNIDIPLWEINHIIRALEKVRKSYLDKEKQECEKDVKEG